MVLVNCRECARKISDQAEACPNCGISNPAIPIELQKLYDELEALREEEKREQVLYEKYYAQIDKFPMVLFRWFHNQKLDKKVKQHVARANSAQYQKQLKQQEIWDYESTLRQQCD